MRDPRVLELRPLGGDTAQMLLASWKFRETLSGAETQTSKERELHTPLVMAPLRGKHEGNSGNVRKTWTLELLATNQWVILGRG